MPLAKIIGEFLIKKIATEALVKLAEKGVTTELAKAVVDNPDLYKKLADRANRRIRRLREAKKLKQSYAYQDLKKEILQPQGRKTISSKSNAGKLYGPDKRSDYLGNAISLLKFLNAKSSTLRGLSEILETKRLNFTNQIIENSNFTPEEEELVYNYLMGLSDTQFKALAKLYEPMLRATQFALGSYESFNLVGHHLMSKINVSRQLQSRQAGKNILQDIKEDQGRKNIIEADPFDLQNKSVQSIAKLAGAEDVKPIPLQDKNGNTATKKLLMSLLKAGIKKALS